MTTRHLTAAVLGLVLLTALGACGRKGPLELPPNADTAQAEPVATEATGEGTEEAADETNGEENPIDARPIDRDMRNDSARGMRNY